MYQPPKRKKRRRKGGIFRRLLVLLILFVLGYGGFFLYYRYGKPYTVALDAGHGGEDVGSVGVIQEVQLTEADSDRLGETAERRWAFSGGAHQKNG